MGKLASLTYKDIEFVLSKLSFKLLRQRGSHSLYGHADGRRVVVAIHKGKNVKEGLAHKIITKEIELSLDEFFKILRGK
jgi:predicted RNA binding protein YcfA (HicA-like mRNA interferase family)